jgi:excinuclease ABC subunit A
MAKLQEYLTIQGAREHNLKDLDLKIPLGKLNVITGLSGSGKSSLAFDTIYAEGQRRYVESLSAYARQFLGLMNKPDVDAIRGLSPAISIEQKSVSKNPRSTVGTITEIYDYLRLLYARIGKPHCPVCYKEIVSQSAEKITDTVLKYKKDTKVQVLAPIIRAKKGTYQVLFTRLENDGFARVRVNGKIYDLSEEIKLDKQKKHNIEVVIDRIKISAEKETRTRVNDAIETALTTAEGLVMILVGDDKDAQEELFSQHLACPDGHVSVEKLQPRLFSFNSPFGACETCHGLGVSQEFDEDLIFPNRDLALSDIGAIAPWKGPNTWRMKYLQSLAKNHKFSLRTPIKKLNRKVLDIVLYGDTKKIEVLFESKNTGSSYKHVGKWEGIVPQMQRHLKETDSDARRKTIMKFMIEKPCTACKGQRLKPVILAVTLGDKNIINVTDMSVEQAMNWVKKLKLSPQETQIAKMVLKEVQDRLRFLRDVGLSYLNLSRSAGTLSGGEAQRIRLATQIGSELRGVMYILDEPSIGLHQRDNQRLITTLKRLRDIGNTLIVVEHDEETMMMADHLIDMGPGAGVHGGTIVAEGTPTQVKNNRHSVTGQYLSGKKSIAVPSKRREFKDVIEVKKAEQNNLKSVDVRFPVGVMTCVTGVSGSGKSTLVNDILYKSLANSLYRASHTPGKHKEIKGIEHFDKVINIDQSPIGRTPRSNPATYIKVFGDIRELFAKSKEAQTRGYKAGRFSFNVSGGRCDHCDGDGVIRIEMHFLPDVYVECEKCLGKRYNRETLEVKYRGKTIADVLDMSVEEALTFFERIPRIQKKMSTLFDVGLGYIKLGQSSTTLSGGEAQRIKLTSELAKRDTGRTMYILDEPTTGLHFADIEKLLTVLDRLVEKGNTIIVIEHNLDVIKTADYIVDLGPEGGDKGGTILATGTPEDIIQVKQSYTGQFLKPLLT